MSCETTSTLSRSVFDLYLLLGPRTLEVSVGPTEGLPLDPITEVKQSRDDPGSWEPLVLRPGSTGLIFRFRDRGGDGPLGVRSPGSFGTTGVSDLRTVAAVGGTG